MRIFVSQSSVCADYIELTDTQFHHVSRVLRIKSGDCLDVVIDQEYVIIIEFISFKAQFLYYKLIQKKTISLDRPYITLFQALPKQDKFMDIVDSVTQCGVAEVYPIITDRSITKLNEAKKQDRLRRWQKQAEQSAMQSKQIRIPIIHPITHFSDFITQDIVSTYDLCLVAWEEGSAFTVKSYIDDTNKIQKIGVFIGPEGGISNHDVDCLVSKGFKIMTIGSTILRVEIAALGAVSQILFFYL